MFNPNLPDNCQGRGTHLPWNEPEQEVYVCWSCGATVEEDDLVEIKTHRDGFQSIAPCCFDD